VALARHLAPQSRPDQKPALDLPRGRDRPRARHRRRAAAASTGAGDRAGVAHDPLDPDQRRGDREHPAGRHRAVPDALADHRSRGPPQRRPDRRRRDPRVVRGEGDVVYAVGIDRNAGDLWHLYRPGRTLFAWGNPDALLGYEQRFLGAAKVERFGEVSTLRITAAREEIILGDLLIPAPREQIVNYVPHPPEKPIDGRIIDLDRNATEAGRGWLVTLDKGAADGLDVGTVLAINRTVPSIPDPRPSLEPDRIERFLEQTVSYQPERWINIPDERTGLLFVYRVFDFASLAILLNTTDPVNVGDSVRNP